MKIVAKRDEAEGELVRAKYSPTFRRHQSRDRGRYRGPGKEALVAAVVKTRAETPDDIFDMFERYPDEREEEQAIPRARSIDDRDYTSEVEEVRDDVDGGDKTEGHDENFKEPLPSSQNERTPPSLQFEQGGEYMLNLIDRLRLQDAMGLNNSEGSNFRMEGLQTSNYILNLIDKLQLKEVADHIHTQSTTTPTQQHFKGQAKEDESYISQIDGLKARLEEEENKNRDLEQKFSRSVKMHQEERSSLQHEIVKLELKIGIQESTHNDRLAEEQQKSLNLGKLLKLKSEEETLRDETGKSQEQLQDLEKEVVRLRRENASLEATLEARQSSFDFYITSTNLKIRELELNQENKTKIPETDRATFETLQLSLENTEAMLESDRTKLRTLQLEERKHAVLLKTERKKCEALEQLNDKMKLAMKKLSKKAQFMDGAQQQISALTKELEKRDKVMSSIKRILSVNEQAAFPRMLSGDEPSTIELLVKEGFSTTYPKSIETSQHSDMAITKPGVKPRKERSGHESTNPTREAIAKKNSKPVWDE